MRYFWWAGAPPCPSPIGCDASGGLEPSAWYGALAAGPFTTTPQPTVLETFAWLAYLVPVLALFLLPARKPAGATAPAPVVPESPEHVDARA